MRPFVMPLITYANPIRLSTSHKNSDPRIFLFRVYIFILGTSNSLTFDIKTVLLSNWDSIGTFFNRNILRNISSLLQNTFSTVNLILVFFSTLKSGKNDFRKNCFYPIFFPKNYSFSGVIKNRIIRIPTTFSESSIPPKKTFRDLDKKNCEKTANFFGSKFPSFYFCRDRRF